MPRYLRSTFGVSFFFTLVTHQRRPILCEPAVRTALKGAISRVRIERPFHVDAMVLLPDHLHCIWTLPEDDVDFSTRWKVIKGAVSGTCRQLHRQDAWVTPSRRQHRESTLWQRRFWEHRIRDDEDFARHADYIHINPVKHGLVAAATDWPYSTFHRYVGKGIYAADWGGRNDEDVRIPE